MHVPAYCPVELGIQDKEKRGVAVEVKKTMVIESIPIISVPDEDDIGMEPAVEVAMGIVIIVFVAKPGIDIDILSMLIGRMCDDKSYTNEYNTGIDIIRDRLAVSGVISRLYIAFQSKLTVEQVEWERKL